MKRLFFVCIIVFASLKSFSWGAKGHKIVAVLAKEALSANQQVIDSVQYFLGKMSFEEASVWMDEVRSDKAYDYLKEKHYVNVERDATYVKNKEDNVVNELELILGILSKKGARDKDKIAFALRELFHLIGDIHQPLHCGYGEDRGGNSIDITYGGKPTNLHALWDSGIITEESISLNDCKKFANSIPVKEQGEIQQVNVVKWMQEAREYLPFIYGFEKGKINSDYSSKAKPIIEKQIVRAGIRLAAILFRNFKR